MKWLDIPAYRAGRASAQLEIWNILHKDCGRPLVKDDGLLKTTYCKCGAAVVSPSRKEAM